MKKNPVSNFTSIFILLLIFFGLILSACNTRGAIRAEEYFSIGMAYFELGNYAEAERWLNRARVADRTLVASEYNLGRIAFETGRFAEAAGHFESVLARDPQNLMALRAAAYSRIRSGDLETAEAHYARVLALIPEGADDGFNHALVLYSMDRFDESEEVLNRYPHSLEENPSAILLLARIQKAQGNIEAVDTYARWMELTPEKNSLGLFEYAEVLEEAGYYARALELYREAISTHVLDTERLRQSTIRFNLARLFLVADPDNAEGLTELETAVAQGFSDTAALEALQRDERVSTEHRDEIRRVLEEIQ